MTIIRPTRRDILKMSSALPAVTLSAGVAASAELGPVGNLNPAHVTFALGEMKLTIVSDGFFNRPASTIAVNADPVARNAFLAAHFLPLDGGYSHTNHIVIDSGDSRVLIDVGSGDRFMPTTGRLMANLAAAGIDPGSITHVIITHAHPDHIWGIRDGFDEAILPGIPYYMGETERTFWMDEGLINRVPAELQQFVLGAQNSIDVDGADWTLLQPDQEVVPGIRVIATPGHTPGHMSVAIESEGEQLFVLGDAMTNPYLDFAHPDWVNEADMDGNQTIATRRRLLDMAATDRIAVLGYHFPFPGIGNVMRDGDAYRFIPALWRFD
ncbi:MBL fold metallo-hydrolase [Puniceibacterium sediminis]|uniref:Glyoxylase, beta-lactamase superfamily II n=1 Tax=Puniceibacterium sediminis TaxID=1608407 RepID=A0A238WRF1_9RHOB|nr:MBL fold metallo-hydrolase [Puniceibacterium sediminis]SNR49190.1 Glyoxylase, beta-lactamase superfamily II [Puniceibacterium sediminis]